MAVIFDLDGTLIDSAPAILKGFEQALAAFALQAVCPLDERLIGPPLLATLKKLSGEEDEQRLNAMADVFRQWYDTEGYRETLVYDGVVAALQALLDRNVPLYIATNKRLHPTLVILQHLGWMPYFRGVYALDKVAPAYRDKASMLEALLQENDISVANSIYVGDTLSDYHAATGNGLRFVAATWGYGELADLACVQLMHPRELADMST